MSNFTCEVCGVDQIDSSDGYISGCGHYKPENTRVRYLVTYKGQSTIVRTRGGGFSTNKLPNNYFHMYGSSTWEAIKDERVR